MNLFGGASRAITSMLVQMPDSDNEEDKEVTNKESEEKPNDEVDPEKKPAEEAGINTTLIASRFSCIIFRIINESCRQTVFFREQGNISS